MFKITCKSEQFVEFKKLTLNDSMLKKRRSVIMMKNLNNFESIENHWVSRSHSGKLLWYLVC